MKYRSRTDIVGVILDTARDGALQTRIMYSACLSFSQIKEYLAMLLDQDMLEYSKEEKEYRTTDKGRRFLGMYGEIGHIMYPKESSMKMQS